LFEYLTSLKSCQIISLLVSRYIRLTIIYHIDNLGLALKRGIVIINCPKCKAANPSTSRFCTCCGAYLHRKEDTKAYDEISFQREKKKLDSGSIIKEKFRIEEVLGGGGMGIVYKAIDTKLKRPVALKFLPHELTQDQEFSQRFIQEAQAASSLDHPNICTIFEINETRDGEIFIAMAYYEGETLKKKIRNAPLPITDVIEIGIQIAQGLNKAHTEGIVHRDIKPANIMVTNENVVKILDFGLAKLSGQTALYKDSGIVGTVEYMSPEQASGEDVDHRTDLWSLGVILYEMLTGQLPFKAENAQAFVYSIQRKTPVPATELRSETPLELESIIYKCLRKNREDRYMSAGLLLSYLEKLRKSTEKETKVSVDYQKEGEESRKEAERRQATVLSIEVTGYTQMLESMDTEEVVSLMSRCFKIISSIEVKYGGRMIKTSENSLNLLFGVPIAIEDAPKKSINAAIEIHNKIHRFTQRENLPFLLNVSIGINTGLVISGIMDESGKKDITVLGETINVAARLRELSPPGKIYVGPLTYKYTKTEFNYKRLKSIAIKGKQEPLPAFELLSEQEKIYRDGLDMNRLVHSEMVGRENELNRLHLHLIKVINSEGSIINIIGEAGIGKSRLILELIKSDEIEKIHLIKGRALSFGKNLSFHPIIDVLKNCIGIKEADTSAEAIDKLKRAIKKYYPEGADEVYPFISTLMGMKMSEEHAERIRGIEGEALEKLILKNLRDLFEKISKSKPLVIILEDIHWADQTSIKFLESLYRLAENNPILFVNVLRPDYKDTSEPLIRTVQNRYKEYYSEIVLESLDERQAGILIDNLLKIKGLSPGIKDIIIRKAGGNPFFIEEVVRSFIDERIVEIKDGQFRITKKIDSVIVPDTINEVLMTRIDRLDEETKSLLKIASVIGRNFFYKILCHVAETIEEIDERLDYLKDIQLILERTRMGEVEYLFKHALAQEAAYGSILLKKRKELHLKIANSIESIFSERLQEFYGMLALHYSKGEDLDKAEEYLTKAGEEALKSSASSEALYYYRDALNIYLRKYGDAAELSKIAMFEKNIALALFNRGQYIEADEYFARVLAYYGEKFPRQFILKITKSALGLFSYLLRIYLPFLSGHKTPNKKDSEIMNLYYKKNTALIFLDPERMFIEIFYWLKRLINFDLKKVENGVGIISMSSAAFSYSGISFRFSKKIMEFIRDKVDEEDVKSVLYYKVPELLHKTFSGDWNNIGEYDENLVNQNVRIGELFYASGYALTHGYLKIARGDFESSQEIAKKLHEIADVYENEYSRASYYWFKAQVAVKFRRLTEALTVSQKGIVFTKKTGFFPYMFSLYAFKARVHIMQGEIENAEEELEYLRRIKPDINLVPYFLCTFSISQVILDICKLEEAIKKKDKLGSDFYQKRALHTAREAIKNSYRIAADVTESLKLMGVYYWILGKQRRAIKCWERSINEGERLGSRLELSRTFMEVGVRLSEEQSRFKNIKGIEAHQYLGKAKSMFKDMELEWDLRKLKDNLSDNRSVP
jgi:serine/threonine protein kinase/tetratricopeptide (TPR) repeat protein